MPHDLSIPLGVKSDPILYRFSYPWLFRLMAEEGVHHLQIGSFFELYQLPDAFFTELRQAAQGHGVTISSLFTAHRELGGFMRCEPHWDTVTRRNYERLIQVGALLGAPHVGSNPGAVLRDQMHLKAQGIAAWLRQMKELLHIAGGHGIACLTIEPMSCLAEPPTLPDEIHGMAAELSAYHQAHPGTADIGYCADTSHGYADASGTVRHTHLELFEAALPYLAELHVKNTDPLFDATFGFNEAERKKGIVDLDAVWDLLHRNAARIPRDEVIAYLELSGPKWGRDYSDRQLEDALRQSLRFVKETFARKAAEQPA